MSEDIKEFGYLLELDSKSLKQYAGGNAMNQRICEWFSHPVGSIADKPGWGRPFGSLRFEPVNVNLENALEMAVVEKLPSDVEGLVISKLRISYPSIDEVSIYLEHNSGTLDERLSLEIT